MSQRSILAELDRQFLAPERPELAPMVNWSGAKRLPVHRWFRYREGFSPDLLTALHVGDHVLDPFCGSGSILVGAAQQGREGIGIDVNPLATFVARVKTTPLSERQLALARNFARTFEARLGDAAAAPTPSVSVADKVFEPEIKSELLRIRGVIGEVRCRDSAVHDFLLLAWISILQDVGSYFKEGNGIKYRRRKRLKDGYVLREEGEWQRQLFGDDQPLFVRTRYLKQLEMMLEDARAEWPIGTWRHQQIVTDSAENLRAHVPVSSCDSILFSPPYANRFDYFESLKVELWFGGFVEDYAELTALRKRSLRSHLGADLNKGIRRFTEVEELVDLMDRNSYAWRMRVPSLVRGYFDDMARVLCACREALVEGGKCSIVVGNSAYGGVIIPTDGLLALIGLGIGFASAKVHPVRHLTVAPQQRTELLDLPTYMRESIVVLR